MLRTFGRFISERAGALISRKVGAALLGEAAVAQANPALTGVPLMLYIVTQAALEGWRFYVDRRWPA